VRIKAPLPSFFGSVELGLLRGLALASKLAMVGAWDGSLGLELPKNSCSGAGSAATSATNQRQGTRSAS